MASASVPLGFTAVPVKFSSESSAQHMSFVKQHLVRDKVPEKPSDRTLFMLNVPPYCTEKSLKNAWKDCGPVQSVFFHQRPNSGLPPEENSKFFPLHEPVKGFKVAYVVFEKTGGLAQALKRNPAQPLILSSQEEPVSCGVKKWCEEYNSRIPNTDELQEDIDKFMAAYDKEVRKRIAQEKDAGEEDEDGWVTVTKRGRNPGFARKDKVDKKIRAQEEKRNKKKQLLNFYSFQIRESKMKNLATLRQKFEEDKKRIQMIKQSRKFKPF